MATATTAPAGRETAARPSPPVREASTGRLGMWIFLATDVMGFGALLVAYAVLRAGAHDWPDPSPRLDRALGAALTFVLLASGLTIGAAVAAARAGERRAAARLTAATAALGLAFLAGQAWELRALAVSRHVALAADQAASIYYVIVGFHGLHVAAGVIALGAVVVVLVAARGAPAAAGEASAERDAGGTLAVVALYWQLVELIWIALFAILYLVPGARP